MPKDSFTDRAYDVLRTYSGLLGALGVGAFQVLNFHPSDHSLFNFAVFTFLAALVVADAIAVLLARKTVWHGAQVARIHTYHRHARLAAAAALILVPIGFTVLTVAYHIPNTWPLSARAGAEPRDADPLIHCLPSASLVVGLDENVGPLFDIDQPGGEMFHADRLMHLVTIDNRSTDESPPLQLTLGLKSRIGQPPRAQVSAAAVTSPMVTEWWTMQRVTGWVSSRFRAKPGTGEGACEIEASFSPYLGTCTDRVNTSGWCFVSPPYDRTRWDAPQIRIPPIPQRSRISVYLEMALREGRAADGLPVTIELRQLGEGKFPVYVRQEADLNARRGRQ
jgi:hypothetical protein